MAKIKVVIGANYGDEGKGLVTDHLVRKFNASAVVRFNGGAQAGHTVVDGDKRHVFHHFGSGTFAGVQTILSSDFIINPILFKREYEVLRGLAKPGVRIQSDAIVTTPYDMMLNQFSAAKLGHGSCGMGINETVTRNQKIPITINDTPAQVRRKLDLIRDNWMLDRMNELGIVLTQEQAETLYNDDIIDQFLEDYWFLNHRIGYGYPEDGMFSNGSRSIIFEGAQGLGLDEINGAFPHVTRSRTGLTNVEKICKQNGETDVEAYYVTRCYLTRHGNGPMENELFSCKPDEGVIELTNVTNEYQGRFRYGLLDLDALKNRIYTDMKSTILRVTPKLVVTCLDQMKSGTVAFYSQGVLNRVPVEDFPKMVARYIGIPHVITSYGPSSSDLSNETLSWI
jgi:adenylosuccinate synthase